MKIGIRIKPKNKLQSFSNILEILLTIKNL